MPLHLPSHWNAVYKDFSPGDGHEWGGMIAGDVASELEMVLKKGPTCVIGAGASGLGTAMLEAGFEPLVEADFSEAIVSSREGRGSAPYLLADATDPEDMAACRDALGGAVENFVDKGLIDGLYLAKQSHVIPSILEACHPVLNPGGRLLFLSYTHARYMEPELRLEGGSGKWEFDSGTALGGEVYWHSLLKVTGLEGNGGRRRRPGKFAPKR